MQRYVDHVCNDIGNARKTADRLGVELDSAVDSIYLGGGTPSTLHPQQIEKLFDAVDENFEVMQDAEITMECAPGTLSAALVQALSTCKVNRVSLGVQSFVEAESRAVGRNHDCEGVLADIGHLRQADVSNISLDLIAGLPHQTRESWNISLEAVIQSGVPHVSVYLLEVDEDSRLGKELVAGGARYHAHHVPDDDLAVEFYMTAIERLESAGIFQYEISNFAVPGFESEHNLKYWKRQPYFGFGLDAHSMLPTIVGHPIHDEILDAVRFSAPDDLEQFLSKDTEYLSNPVSIATAQEEEFFLGLRLNRGIDLRSVQSRTGLELPQEALSAIDDLLREELLCRVDDRLRLTPRGRLLSNEVFARFIADKPPRSARLSAALQ